MYSYYVGMVHAKRDEIFRLGDHSFDSKVSNILSLIHYIELRYYESIQFTLYFLQCYGDMIIQLACVHGRQMEEECMEGSSEACHQNLL